MSATAREIDVYLVYYFTPFRPVLSIGFEGKLKIQIPARPAKRGPPAAGLWRTGKSKFKIGNWK